METIFLRFLARRSISYSGNVFFNECFVPGCGNWFSGLYKPFFIYFLRPLPVKAFFPCSRNVFLNESFIPAIGKGFFSLETVYFIWKFISNIGNHHWCEWKTIFKGRTYSCEWKLIFWLRETIFFHCHRYFSRSPSSRIMETHFSVQKKKYCFLFRIFFPSSRIHYLNYREAYLKLLLLLLTTILSDFQIFLSM